MWRTPARRVCFASESSAAPAPMMPRRSRHELEPGPVSSSLATSRTGMPLGFVGRMAAKTALGRAADELAERLADQTEAAIDTAVRLRAPALASGVEVERLLYPDLELDLFLAHLVRRRAKLSATVGAVTAAPAVFPGIGTAVARRLVARRCRRDALRRGRADRRARRRHRSPGRRSRGADGRRADRARARRRGRGARAAARARTARRGRAWRDPARDARRPQPRARRACRQAHRPAARTRPARARAAVRRRCGARRSHQLPVDARTRARRRSSTSCRRRSRHGSRGSRDSARP